jgi:hypothetical protein
MRAHIPCAYRVSQMYTVYCTHVSHTSVTSLEAQSPTGLPPSFSNGTSFVLPLQQNINAARATAAPLTEPPAAGTSHTRYHQRANPPGPTKIIPRRACNAQTHKYICTHACTHTHTHTHNPTRRQSRRAHTGRRPLWQPHNSCLYERITIRDTHNRITRKRCTQSLFIDQTIAHAAAAHAAAVAEHTLQRGRSRAVRRLRLSPRRTSRRPPSAWSTTHATAPPPN